MSLRTTTVKAIDEKSTQLQEALRGTEQVISYPGVSQYGDGGVSACGLAALNFARIALEQSRDSKVIETALKHIVSRNNAKQVLAICGEWQGTAHLETDDIYRIPLFESSLKLSSTKYGAPKLNYFKELLHELEYLSTSAVAIITRPPEILACLRLIVNQHVVFVIFDSHPRVSHPDGAAFILNTSLDATATRLSEILHFDDDFLKHGTFQWQAQLLGHCSSHIFLSRDVEMQPEHMMQTIFHSSLTILALRAELEDLKIQHSSLSSYNKQLESEVEQLEDERRDLISEQKAKQNKPRTVRKATPSFSNVNAYDPSLPPTDRLVLGAADPHRPGQAKGSSTDASIAELQQKYFDEENRQLRNEREELSLTQQRRFRCGICLEEHPEDHVARVDVCCHEYCRECLRGYVNAKLEEHRFPILCPICVLDKDRVDLGKVNNMLVQQIGISEQKYEIWTELEMIEFSVLLHCRKCRQSAFVDKQDHSEMDLLVCPLPGCQHLWCKTCQQSVDVHGPQHSCDGSSELNHLMQQRGWKFCPNCRIPIQKDTGCNHMTCISPGCNTHFCYLCGQSIIRSAMRRDIQNAISAHYRQCNLIDVIPDRGVPP